MARPHGKKPDDTGPGGMGPALERYGLRGFTTLLVIDRDGTTVVEIADMERDRMESLIQNLVDKADRD
jgi:hypothetical protein